MDLIGQEIALLWYTRDADGNLQNTDSTPTVTITGPGNVTDQVTTNEGVGVYRTVFTGSGPGRYAAKFTADIDQVAEVAVQYRVLHDGVAEAQASAFPDGLASWSSAVV